MDYDQTTALIVVDVQNDFADPDGSLYVDGGETAIEFINDQVSAATEAGAFIVYTRDWHPERTPHFTTDGGPWPPHCVMGTWGAEFHPSLVVEGTEVEKGSGGEDGYSGFTLRDPETGEESPTGLAGLLRERNVERIAVVGLALDYCVKATAIDGAAGGFDTRLLADGTRAVNMQPGDHTRAVAAMVEAGVTVE